MNSSPLILIMLPTYNRSRLILRAVQSIIQQSYKNYKVYIINDGSTESYQDLEDLIKDNPKFIYRKSENIGINKTRNQLLDEFGLNTGIPNNNTYICTFSDDDIFTKDAFQQFASTISHFPRENWFCFNCELISSNVPNNINYKTIDNITYKEFRKNWGGDKHFLFKLSILKDARYPHKYFKNGYEHIFNYKVPANIQIIPKTVKFIEYQDDGLSASDLYENADSFKTIFQHILLDPKQLDYYKMLLNKKTWFSFLKKLHPKEVLKALISKERYYRLKKKFRLKTK